MSKKDFIALANAIRQHNHAASAARDDKDMFTASFLDTLADFCHSQNRNFKRGRWLDYIAGKCGSNGGTIKS